jgi:hypothetical protein
MAGWGQYAQMVRKCNDQIYGAGIFGHDGTLWGQEGLPMSTAEHVADAKKIISIIVSLCVEDIDTTNSIFQTGFKAFEKEWAVVRIETSLFVAKGKAPNTSQLCARKTGRCVVVAAAHPEGANTNAISGAVQIGEFLEDSGY